MLGTAPRTKETLPDFWENMDSDKRDTTMWYRVTRNPQEFVNETLGFEASHFFSLLSFPFYFFITFQFQTKHKPLFETRKVQGKKIVMECEIPENPNFLWKGKTVISIEKSEFF